MEQEMDRYQLGLYEKAMPDLPDWETKLLLCRQCGFDWLEISIDETDKKLSRLEYDRYQLKALKRAIANTGVAIQTMCLSGHRRFPFGSHDGAIRAKSLEIMDKALELSGELGVKIIQIAGYDVYYEPSNALTEQYFAENLMKAVERAASCGIFLGFETMETPFMDTVGKAMTYVRLADSPYLGVYPDIGNLKNAAVLYGHDVVSDLEKGRGHIFAAHLKETSPGVYRDMMFGTTGHTEYVRCIKELWRQGVRLYTGEFWHKGEENNSEMIRDAAVFLREKIRQATDEREE